jgi:hypothetical protein
MKTAGFGTRNRLMLIAELRLYANNHVPIYHVVVGDVIGADKVAACLEKIGVIDLQVSSPMRVPGDEADHWMPTCWPLPFWQNGAPQKGG